MEINGSLTLTERNASNGAKKHCSNRKNTREKLPQELVIEILSRLPTKHLLPLRFVSKTWLQLLTKDPQFAKLQYDRFIRTNPNPSILASKCREANENDSNIFLATAIESCDEAVRLEYPFYQADNKYNLSGICNGLLCVSRLDDKEIYIWNPLINDHISISCLPSPSIRYPGYQSYTAFGFGFDGDSNVYKVVRFFNETEVNEFLWELDNTWTQISVYAIGVDAMWRTVEVDVPHSFTHTSATMPLVNGVLHWHKYRPGTNARDVIVTFDLKEEVRGELILPHGIEFNEIVELAGFLGAFDRCENGRVNVWVMTEYGIVSSWCIVYIIGKPGGSIAYYRLRALGFTHNGEILLSYYGYPTMFNPRTNVSTDLKEFQFRVSITFPFLGSIISPTLISRAGRNLLAEEK